MTALPDWMDLPDGLGAEEYGALSEDTKGGQPLRPGTTSEDAAQ